VREPAADHDAGSLDPLGAVHVDEAPIAEGAIGGHDRLPDALRRRELLRRHRHADVSGAWTKQLRVRRPLTRLGEIQEDVDSFPAEAAKASPRLCLVRARWMLPGPDTEEQQVRLRERAARVVYLHRLLSMAGKLSQVCDSSVPTL